MPSSVSTAAPLLAHRLRLARSLRHTQCVPSHSVRPLEYVSSCCFRALSRAPSSVSYEGKHAVGAPRRETSLRFAACISGQSP
ncbi:hypothetical protein NDU88_001904 [Pleurodeles waltl]|uniref:Uncharacterized protein n=1 Tax=Pleurodeles waltl TaxID=8319 RepID=A0AAV7KQN0_PLEWA|nr:hypothetical protein NDU88_001904 [Pleurodeles waltl]